MDKEMFKTILKLVSDEKDAKEEESTCEQGLIKIVILQRGWVFVGRYFRDGNDCRLEDAQCVRVWGTTKGLGQLASEGPTDKTVLDPTDLVEFHKLTEVCSILCDQKNWKSKLK